MLLYLSFFQLNANSAVPSKIMTVSGNQGPYWKRESIEVHSNGYEIIFQGVVGNGTEGDIAIDSVAAVERSCCKSRLELITPVKHLCHQ